MRLRITAPPIFLVTVKPIRAVSPFSGFFRATIKKPGLLARFASRNARKSRLFLITDTGTGSVFARSPASVDADLCWFRPIASYGPWRDAQPILYGQPWSLCAHENRGGAFFSAGSVGRSVSLSQILKKWSFRSARRTRPKPSRQSESGGLNAQASAVNRIASEMSGFSENFEKPVISRLCDRPGAQSDPRLRKSCVESSEIRRTTLTDGMQTPYDHHKRKRIRGDHATSFR